MFCINNEFVRRVLCKRCWVEWRKNRNFWKCGGPKSGGKLGTKRAFGMISANNVHCENITFLLNFKVLNWVSKLAIMNKEMWDSKDGAWNVLVMK